MRHDLSCHMSLMCHTYHHRRVTFSHVTNMSYFHIIIWHLLSFVYRVFWSCMCHVLLRHSLTISTSYHFCVTFSCVIYVSHSLVSFLCHILSCQFYVISMSHCVMSFLCHIVSYHFCVTLCHVISMSHSIMSVLCHILLCHICVTLCHVISVSHSLVSLSCHIILLYSRAILPCNSCWCHILCRHISSLVTYSHSMNILLTQTHTTLSPLHKLHRS